MIRFFGIEDTIFRHSGGGGDGFPTKDPTDGGAPIRKQMDISQRQRGGGDEGHILFGGETGC